MSRKKSRARLLPGSKDGEPIVVWDGEPVHFPVRDELFLHASSDGVPPPPQSKVIDASGRVLCTYEASLEDVIGETAEAEVRASARATVEHLQALLESGRTALAAHPGSPAGEDVHEDDDEPDDDEDFSLEIEYRRHPDSPFRSFLRHAGAGAAAYVLSAFLLPMIEAAAVGMPGEGGILFITGLAGVFLPIIAFLNGVGALFDVFDML